MAAKSAILVGVGGQGAILTAKVLVNGLMETGYDVKMSEVHGMSQRGAVSPPRFTGAIRCMRLSLVPVPPTYWWLLKKWRLFAMLSFLNRKA